MLRIVAQGDEGATASVGVALALKDCLVSPADAISLPPLQVEKLPIRIVHALFAPAIRRLVHETRHGKQKALSAKADI